MLFRGDSVVGDWVGLTSPRRSSKDGSVVLGVSVGFACASEKVKRKFITIIIIIIIIIIENNNLLPFLECYSPIKKTWKNKPLMF